MTETTDKRVAIVTGASRGIGAAIARSLAARGRHVVLMARSAEKLDAVRGEIESAGGSADAAPVDVGDGEALAAAIQRIAETHGRLDILVNNAGITRDALVLRMSDEQFDEVIRINLRSVFVACRAAAKPMIRGKWGRIINIASVAGTVGNAGQANYAASKGGVISLTRTLAKELAGKRITANAVAPGFIETDMTESLPDQVKEMARQVTPLKCFGQSEHVAAAVAYFAADEAGYTTGQVLSVDGGMTMC